MALTKTPIELSSTPSIVDGGNATAITIDSSENVLVGKTALEYENTAGHIFRNDGLQSSIRSGGNVVDFNRLSSDGEVIRLSKDGTTVGAIATWDGDLAVGQENVALKFNDGQNEILPWSVASNLNRDNAFNLGSSSSRFKDLYLSGGAYLGGTGASNKLDDYEEGTFSATATGTGTLSVVNEKYTKIGNVVTVYFQVDFSGASGDLTISGLPFTSTPFTKSVGIGREDATNGYAVYGRLSSSSTSIAMYYAGATGNATPFQVAAGNFGFSITYFTNL